MPGTEIDGDGAAGAAVAGGPIGAGEDAAPPASGGFSVTGGGRGDATIGAKGGTGVGSGVV